VPVITTLKYALASLSLQPQPIAALSCRECQGDSYILGAFVWGPSSTETVFEMKTVTYKDVPNRILERRILSTYTVHTL
jgi:hypothetical protein